MAVLFEERTVRAALARMLTRARAEPRPPMPELKLIASGLFRDIRLSAVVECRSLGEVERAFLSGALEPVSYAFRCRYDLGSHFRNAFGTLIASPYYAACSGVAWRCSREAGDAWMSDMCTRFSALGALLATNLVSCLWHEVMFSVCGRESAAAIMERWRTLFLAGNFPGGTFASGLFTVFVA